MIRKISVLIILLIISIINPIIKPAPINFTTPTSVNSEIK